MKRAGSPKVAIVGRPNVGKSSLFNRIVGARKAIVESTSGTTRDRIHADITWKGKGFTVIDTAGFDPSVNSGSNPEDAEGFEKAGSGDMAGLIMGQLKKGIEEADIILFVTDGMAGITPQDADLSSVLRKTSKKIYLAVNKIDKESDAGRALDFFELGLGEPYAISAMHGRGIERLCNDIVKGMGKAAERGVTPSVRVAIIGRPNVGKSSYLNCILSEDRVIVHPTAGTTRDAVDIDLNYKERDYVFIDTAGIRHNAKIKEAADFYGSVRSKEAIKRSDVAIVLLDGYEGLTKDDARVIELIIDEGKALIIAVNKWDLVKGTEMSKYRDRLIRQMNDIRNFPVVFISCKTGRNVRETLDLIWAAYERYRVTILPDKLAATLKSLNCDAEMVRRRINFRYLVQEGTMPPGFILGVKGAGPEGDNTRRFAENFLRKAYDLEGVPIKVRFKK